LKYRARVDRRWRQSSPSQAVGRFIERRNVDPTKIRRTRIEDAGRLKQSRETLCQIAAGAPILRNQDEILLFSKKELKSLYRSRNPFQSNVKPNPNRPLTEQVSPEFHATEVRKHECWKIERAINRHHE
jgi:hypothetical protein